jgi:ornithine cyclodeaminase/alanine dehydrogenase-like protein (mu-crystallin family)
VVGMLGAGGMARTHMEAFTRVRKIEKLQVFSPTKESRERFGREMMEKYNIEVKVCSRPEDVYKGSHILAALTGREKKSRFTKMSTCKHLISLRQILRF